MHRSTRLSKASSTASTSIRATSAAPGSRLFVQESIVEPVIRKLRDRIQTLRVGNPLDKNTDVGAINSRMQLDKIRELVDSGVEEGAEMVQSQCALPARGYWFAPTFFTGVSQSYRIAQEEIFGPVCPC